MLKIPALLAILSLSACAVSTAKLDADPRLQNFKETLSCSSATYIINARPHDTRLYTDRCIVGYRSLTLGEACDMYTQNRFGREKYYTHFSQDEAVVLMKPLPNGHDVMWKCEGYAWK